MTLYHKVLEVSAEQFDGSLDQIDGYNIRWDSQTNEMWLDTLEGSKSLKVGDWIVIDDFGNYQNVDDLVFREEYKEVGTWR